MLFVLYLCCGFSMEMCQGFKNRPFFRFKVWRGSISFHLETEIFVFIVFSAILFLRIGYFSFFNVSFLFIYLFDWLKLVDLIFSYPLMEQQIIQLDLSFSWAFGVKWSPSGNTLAYVGQRNLSFARI